MPRKNMDLANTLMLNNQEPVELVEAEEIHEMSLSELKREKDLLAARRQQLMLRLDGEKLNQALRINEAMNIAISKVIEAAEVGNAQDFKYFMEGYERLVKCSSMITRLDSVDGTGKAARLALQVDFGNGTSVKTMIET